MRPAMATRGAAGDMPPSDGPGGDASTAAPSLAPPTSNTNSSSSLTASFTALRAAALGNSTNSSSTNGSAGPGSVMLGGQGRSSFGLMMAMPPGSAAGAASAAVPNYFNTAAGAHAASAAQFATAMAAHQQHQQQQHQQQVQAMHDAAAAAAAAAAGSGSGTQSSGNSIRIVPAGFDHAPQYPSYDHAAAAAALFQMAGTHMPQHMLPPAHFGMHPAAAAAAAAAMMSQHGYMPTGGRPAKLARTGDATNVGATPTSASGTPSSNSSSTTGVYRSGSSSAGDFSQPSTASSSQQTPQSAAAGSAEGAVSWDAPVSQSSAAASADHAEDNMFSPMAMPGAMHGFAGLAGMPMGMQSGPGGMMGPPAAFFMPHPYAGHMHPMDMHGMYAAAAPPGMSSMPGMSAVPGMSGMPTDSVPPLPRILEAMMAGSTVLTPVGAMPQARSQAVSPIDSPTRRRRSSAPPNNWQCEFCGRAFKNRSDLIPHVRTHTGEKPFVCSVPGCGRAFAHSSNLRAHEKAHARAPFVPGSRLKN